MDVLQVLGTLGGAARREELLAAGVSPKQLRVAHAQGRIVRAWAGCYALPDAPRAVLDARILRGEVTCISALDALGLPLLTRSGQTHILLPRDRGFALRDARVSRGVRLHRSARNGATERIAALPRNLSTPVATSLDVAARCVEPLEHLVLVDAAVNRGLIAPSAIAAFRVSPRSRREFLATHVDGRSESLLESITRFTLDGAGLTVEPQVRIAGVGRVDLVVEGSLVVELDGRAYHADERAFAEDRRRDRKLAALGYTVLRFTYDDVVKHPERMLAEVLAVLAVIRTGRSATTLGPWQLLAP
ncbi:MAG: hypothetical protein CVT64_00390 [Actinobacteria bacterium HGW-Actinobacteria-4]|nr:MAG: hypothetical protein CVT64_00390 [Actinobacteria bacterium HGW-Actinobacteria-4]